MPIDRTTNEFPTAEVPVASLASRVTPGPARKRGTESLHDEVCRLSDRVVFYNDRCCRVVFPQDELDIRLKSKLRQQCRLIRLLDSPFVLPLESEDLESRPPSLTLRRPGRPLGEQLIRLDGRQRLVIAGQLVALMRDAHRFGLVHNQMHLRHLYLANSEDGQARIEADYLALLADEGEAWRKIDPSAGAVAAELRGMHGILDSLVADVIHLQSDTSNSILEGRRRVVLQKLLERPTGDPPEIHEWIEAFGQWVPSGDDVLPPESVDLTSESDPNDQTGVVQVNSVGGIRDSGPTDEVSALEPRLDRGTQIGRFRIDEPIGEGGMGTVYRGVDLSNDETVAIKVLRLGRGDVVQAIRRFRKEARLLAEVQNDYVTRLFHVGDQGGIHYMAMEYIAGTNLKQWSADRLPIPESDALQLIADIARSLVDAHQAGIVHRDIKPENILLQRRSLSGESVRDFRIKLSDFGIARHINQSQSLEVTRAGSMLGTPRYMSPEQCKGSDEVTPSADVYSLGVTLFELLTGAPPFSADDAMRVAAMHCFDPPPAADSFQNPVSEATARIVAKSLAKEPAKRFSDAADMLREVERVIRGEPADIEAHPKAPDDSSKRIWSKQVCWELVSSPDELWPFVSNTDRLNRALGLPSVDYRSVQDPDLGLRKFGSFRLGGVKISWEEHPFEWLEGRRMGILREFDSGPFEWFMSIVTLEPHGSGTKLRHEVRIAPRNFIGKVITKVEADWKGFRSLDRVYGRIDRSIQGQLKSRDGHDAYEPTDALSRNAEMRLEKLVDAVSDEGVDPTLAAAIADYLRQTSPQPLAQIRPYRLTDEIGFDSDSVLDACLVAASKGMLQLRWEVLCPTCKVAADTFSGLSAIESHTRCEACNVNFESDMAESIELVFRPHPEIKQVDDRQYCIGGPEHSPHVVAQLRVEPGERIELDLNLIPGDYLLRSTRIPRSQALRVKEAGAPSQIEARVLDFGSSDHTPTVRAGAQRLALTNDDERLHVVRIERSVNRLDCVTAGTVSALQRFRDLFPEQRLSGGSVITSKQTTLLATEITNIDELYERIGDADAYRCVRDYQERLSEVVRRHGGTVVKTSGESTLSAFHRCDDAVRAAFAFSQACPSQGETGCTLGVGIHRGQTLIASENSQTDFFGSVVRAAIAIAPAARDGMLMTESVFADPAVVGLLPLEPTSETTTIIDLPGLPQQRMLRIPHDKIGSQ